MTIYLNDQLKKMYNVTDKDYEDWCKKNNKPTSYKSSVSEFVYKLMTKRLVKIDGNLVVKKPRKKKARR